MVVNINDIQMEQGKEQGWMAVRLRGGGGRPARHAMGLTIIN